MAAHGAFRLQRMISNLHGILGVELLCAAQGIEFRTPLVSSDPMVRCIARLREDVATLAEDRFLAPDIEKASKLVASNEITEATGVDMPHVCA